jgi:hypothetical protein
MNTIIQQNCAGNKMMSFKIVVKGKAKVVTENGKGLNLAVVKLATVQVIKLPL